MDPYTLIYLAGLIGTTLSAAFAQSEAIGDAAQFSFEIAKINAENAEVDAYLAERDGYSVVARHQSITDQTIGAQRAAYASAGVDVNFGTAKDVQKDTKLTGLLNGLDIEKSAYNKANGYKKEAANIRVNSSVQQAQSILDQRATETSGIGRAATIGISGYSRYSE